MNQLSHIPQTDASIVEGTPEYRVLFQTEGRRPPHIVVRTIMFKTIALT
jgi:hypothetical protein